MSSAKGRKKIPPEEYPDFKPPESPGFRIGVHRPGREENKVIFNGNGDELQFAWCDDRESIPQARRNAADLAGFLSSSTGEKVSVTAVLAIPGWYVDRRARSDVVILSGRNVVNFFGGCRTVLDGAQIQRIVHQVEGKCRDVEF